MYHSAVRLSVMFGMGIAMLSGCDLFHKPVTTSKVADNKKAPAKTETVAVKDKTKTPETTKPKEKEKFDFAKEIAGGGQQPVSNSNDGNNGRNTSTGTSNFSSTSAIEKVSLEVRDALKIRDTLVVFVIDRTSGSQMRSDATSALTKMYQGADKPVGDNPPNKLYGAVVAYSDDAQFATKEPLSKEGDIRTAITGISEASGKANTFAAVKKAADEFLLFRDEKKCMMIMVLLSLKPGSDVGTDYKNVDAAVGVLKKAEVPCFAIGASTPFSQAAAKNLGGPEAGITESLAWERIELDYPDRQNDNDLNDTGFPPFGIGRLCGETGGQFFAQRPLAGSMTGQFDPGYFRKYAPDYVSKEKFDAILAGNKAKAALVKAAKEGGHVEVYDATGTQMYYKKGSEANFNSSITKTQQTSARIDGGIERLLKMLQAGEPDRANLKEARWQANFDLAIGRAYAAKARVEGIDTMLATLKGKSFAKAESDRWIISAAPSTTSISSVDNLAKKARMYLERVIKDHPNTPWAKSAERDLKGNAGNMGWDLKEGGG